MTDSTDMTIDELKARMAADAQQIAMREAAAQADAANRRSLVADSVEALTGLLGPSEAQPGVDSIRAVRAFDAADLAAGNPRGTTMAENSGLALSLLYEGLEMVTANALNIAHILKSSA